MSRDWMADANCLDEDPELFFLGTPNAIAAAKAVCGGCKVRVECEQYAKDIGADFGVWGKKTEDERDSRKVSKPDPTPSTRCGTYSGYGRHRKLGEALCVPCKQAARAYEQEHRRKYGRRKASA